MRHTLLIIAVALTAGCFRKAEPPPCVSERPVECQHTDPTQSEWWEDQEFAKASDPE